MRLDYLVGGFRISVAPNSTTPGPRTHILGFVEALRRGGVQVKLRVASTFPGMGRFARVRESDYMGASSRKVFLADLVRIAAALWCGFVVFFRTVGRSGDVEVIYERLSVFQSLTSFHAGKRKAVRVIEANGILTRETAVDRKVLVLAGLAGWLERRVLRRADVIVAVSDALAREVSAYAGVPIARIVVIPNGADPALAAAPVSPRASAPRIGFVGTVVAWQRLDKLLTALATPESEVAGAQLQIIGDGPELAPLKVLAQELGVGDRVDFTGSVPHAQAMELMRSWSIGYAGHEKSSSAVMYHSPLKLYEYAALGLHVICTPSADARSLADDGASVSEFSASDESSEAISLALVAAVHAALADSESDRAARRAAVTEKHTWDARSQVLLDNVAKKKPTLR